MGHQNKLFRVSHTGAPVDTRGVSMCENCTKKVNIPEMEKNNAFSLELCQKDNCTTLPSNISYYYFWPQISVC
ncbi:hypothetical protein AB205_0170240 [Aquarana catesbeiana]|uniref:Uncharacterized protein n=1 Tax=Aquarana catesbeiana TaxID=8400 RepID=A0A2G9Q3F3_AQUCT|nr:hypothetical protein AB205_0170240 [Aquarana catesbeiana]